MNSENKFFSDRSVSSRLSGFTWTRTFNVIMSIFRLDLRRAAIDEKFDTVNKAGVIRSEEDDRLGDLIGRTRATERCGRRSLRREFFDLRVAHAEFGLISGRYDGARTDDIDANIPTFQILRPRPRK